MGRSFWRRSRAICRAAIMVAVSHPKAILIAVLAIGACAAGYKVVRHSMKYNHALAEVQRRLTVCDDIYYAIDLYRENPNFLTQQRATVAKSRIDDSDLGPKRAGVLHAYWSDVDACQTGEDEACGRTAGDRTTALRACAYPDFDYESNPPKK